MWCSQDKIICRVVTNEEWKLPKDVLICLTIRYLHRIKQLTQILIRMGHCESYQYSLDIETALVEAIDNTSTHLTPLIVIGDINLIIHSQWEITTNLIVQSELCFKN